MDGGDHRTERKVTPLEGHHSLTRLNNRTLLVTRDPAAMPAGIPALMPAKNQGAFKSQTHFVASSARPITAAGNITLRVGTTFREESDLQTPWIAHTNCEVVSTLWLGFCVAGSWD